MPPGPDLPVIPSAPAPVAGGGPAGDLPVLGGEPRERADAARNRRRILSATETLVARDGAACVSMDRIAEAAGVGKGTLFRRFGDRAGLLRSLLSDRESAFQDELIRGAPPLGPGAPARERILAFGPAYLTQLEDFADLITEIERSLGTSSRLASPVYQLYRTHLTLLLREVGPAVDPEIHADMLLAPLAAGVVTHQRIALGLPVERIAAAWCALAGRLVDG
jgi:AcrR family transcriptional regulator